MATELAPAKVALDVLDSLLEGCQVIGFDYRYLYVNTTVAEQAQRAPDELIGRTMAECFPGIEGGAMYAALTRCMADRAPHRMVNEFAYPDGSTGWFELRMVPVPEGVCILSIDITEQKRAQEALAKSEDQLRQAQKMEAIGRLAGGVAHDFNNMLSVILSYAGLSREDLPEGHPVRDDLLEIEKAGRRAATLTSQLLAISRQQVVALRALDVNELVTEMAAMLRRVLGENIVFRMRLGERVAPMLANAGHIEQVLLNLAVNARDAMPGGGTLTIETATVELDAAYATDHLGARPGPHVMIAVSDTGVGMDRETQARIFEPFFTTKPAGKGTGLGLSTVFGIVQQSGGAIWVYSEVGQGTMFKVYFPVAPAEHTGALAPAPAQAEAEDRIAAGARRLTVLLVEDDTQIRKLTQVLLERDGYDVVVAASAADALQVARDARQRVDLLLTDLVMPEMSGRELSDEVRRIRPAVKVLYMSGYTGDMMMHQGVLDHGSAFIQKPLTPASLARALEQVVAPPASSDA